MKKIIALLIISLSFVVAENVAVLEFQSKSVAANDTSAIADSFRSQLVNTKNYTVLDRNYMSKIMEEQSFQQTGCTDSACAVELGKLLNMEFMFVGALSKVGSTYLLNIKMISVETGKIVKAKEERSKSVDGLIEAANKLAHYFAGITYVPTPGSVPSSPYTTTYRSTYTTKKLRSSAKVLSVKGREVTINAGLNDKIKYKQKFDVVKTIPHSKIDNNSGKKVTYYTTDKIGEIILTELDSGTAKARIISGRIKKGDHIDLRRYFPVNAGGAMLKSLISPIWGYGSVKKSKGSMIMGIIFEITRDLFLADILLSTVENSYTTEASYEHWTSKRKGGLTGLPYAEETYDSYLGYNGPKDGEDSREYPTVGAGYIFWTVFGGVYFLIPLYSWMMANIHNNMSKRYAPFSVMAFPTRTGFEMACTYKF